MSRLHERLTPLRRPSPHCTCFSPFGRAEFFREEFLKHLRCLDQQREYFSPEAIKGVECALHLILGRLDTLSRQQDGERVLSGLLKKLDTVTRLSAWDDLGRAH